MRTRARQVVVAVAALATVAVAGCGDDSGTGTATGETTTASPSAPPTDGSPSATTGRPSPSASTPPAESCPELKLVELSLAERVGQLFMGGIQVGEYPAAVSETLGTARVGSLLFIGQLTGGTEASAEAAERGRAVAGAPAGVQPFVAVDQEGGLVQHLKGPGFATMPSAEEQAGMTPAELSRAAEAWGEDLRAGGVDLNLAPVADVVPAEIGDANQPVGKVRRGYGSDASMVAEHVTAYVDGMHAAGVATSVKHFPGLGKVEGNTDFSSGVVDALTTRDDPDLAPFAAGLDAGAEFLMIALATYQKIDPERRAVFSPIVIDGMVRDDLGYDGPVISDDLSMAEEVQAVPPAKRALDFLNAGGDIVIAADPSVLPEMTGAVIDEAESDPEFAAAVDEHVLRVLTTKEQMGLLTCE